MNITKAHAKEMLGIKTDVELAALLGTTKQNVGRWAEAAPLPDARHWQLQAMRPELFGATPTGKTKRKAA